MYALRRFVIIAEGTSGIMLQDRSLEGDKLINSSHILESQVRVKHVAVLCPYTNRFNILHLGILHVFMRVLD